MRPLTRAVVWSGLVAGTVALIRHGMQRNVVHAGALRRRLDAERRPRSRAKVSFHDIGDLPQVVQRYLRKVLKEGQAVVNGAHIQHSGSFRMTLESEHWWPFISDQVITTEPPGFDWHARIKLAPGLDVHVHDAYIAGLGILDARLMGLFPVARQQDSNELAAGELMRFLAEAVWYPTALLPSQGVQWRAIDARSALAMLNDGHASVTLCFRFDEDGLISSVHARARGCSVGGRVVPTPWQGRFRDYRVFNGMLLPSEGDVGWILNRNEKTYWRGRITSIRHEA